MWPHHGGGDSFPVRLGGRV
uniref:Uncharacterized protein n=1 Tax=Anguilla anguilla TaxID=7936 RepID=A0A0E9VE57_ANGAN